VTLPTVLNVPSIKIFKNHGASRRHRIARLSNQRNNKKQQNNNNNGEFILQLNQLDEQEAK
jgi:hypothetical protein